MDTAHEGAGGALWRTPRYMRLSTFQGQPDTTKSTRTGGYGKARCCCCQRIPVAKDFNVERTNWVDSTVYFLEHPMTELTIGTMAVALTFGHNSVRRVQPRVE